MADAAKLISVVRATTALVGRKKPRDGRIGGFCGHRPAADLVHSALAKRLRTRFGLAGASGCLNSSQQ